jgi:hypothetical protein
MKSGWGVLGLLSAVTVGVVPTTGCSINACPAIGYARTLTVNIEGNVGAVSDVRVCDETRCSEPEPTAGAPVPKKTVITEFSPDPQQTVTYPPFHSRREDQDTWVFTVNSGDPARVTVRALAADGTMLAEQEHDLVWTRVGGTEQCGGPVTAPPILLSVP